MTVDEATAVPFTTVLYDAYPVLLYKIVLFLCELV
jgi:hypothetical protein